jgi:O-antigen ligase
MNVNSRSVESNFRDFNKSVLAAYIIVLILALATLTVFLVLRGQYPIILALLAIPTVVLIITQPRWALYQYVFCLFVMVAIDREIPIFLTDISALLVIAAAALDLLTSNRLPRQFPRLFFNFIFLLTALSIAAVFGYDPVVSLNPLARITFLMVTFLSLYRLVTKAGIERLVGMFFWVCVLHSIIVVVPFIISGGEMRSFGFSGSVYDDLAMLTLPVGLALFIWSKAERATKYLLGSLLIFSSLVATQSRASLAFAVFALAAVLILSLGRYRQIAARQRPIGEALTGSEMLCAVKKRVAILCLSMVLLAAAVISLMPDVYGVVLSRFESALTFTPSGTVRTRLELWRSALMAFSHHPILGVGPGSFRIFHQIFPTLHMQPLHYYVRGLSAHSLFLHYLAEAGLLGAAALVALFINQFRISRSTWRRPQPTDQIGCSLALYVVGLMFLVTTLLEAGWIWGQFGFPFVFFAALIVRYHQQVSR